MARGTPILMIPRDVHVSKNSNELPKIRNVGANELKVDFFLGKMFNKKYQFFFNYTSYVYARIFIN